MVDEPQGELRAALSSVLGYLNFSEGRPDPRVARALDDAAGGVEKPWIRLGDLLREELARLRGSSSAFRDAVQAEAVITLTLERFLPAYRAHHADLLAHQEDRDLYTPFFLARAFEAILAQGGPWDEVSRVIDNALRQINDFVGLRPVAVLESRPRGEPYDHEKVRPLPLYIDGAGLARGRYHELLDRGLTILRQTDPELLEKASLDLTALEELALDPRAYDFDHPFNKRPNYLFGEWDPHRIDNKGRYRRYVARQITLDVLLERVASGSLDRAEALEEAAAVFAGTMLMATMISGAGPGYHDSATTLSTLTPQIAQLRDLFYTQAMERVGITPRHNQRLRAEAQALRQPFGGARQHLNAHQARRRALHVQQRHLAVVFADMGYPDASRDEAQRIDAASVRLLGEVHARLASTVRCLERGDRLASTELLPEIEQILKRGIDCGALVDPWNILGFQGMFPIFQSREDAVRDPRIHELVAVLERLLGLYARTMSESAAHGETERVQQLAEGMERLATWWDSFATTSVNEVRPVHGGEALASARHVAEALARWHERGEAAADLGFWRDHIESFESPKAFALVVEALLKALDHRAALGLLVAWLSRFEEVPLEDGEHSFHDLVLSWMLSVGSGPGPASATDRWALMTRLLDSLEANAEDYWNVPSLELAIPAEEDETEENLFEAAYEGVTFEDSTDDEDNEVSEGEDLNEPFDLEAEADGLLRQLRFLGTVARLRHLAARRSPMGLEPSAREDTLVSWLEAARIQRANLLELLDNVHDHEIPEPVGAFETLVEYDRRRILKEQVLEAVIATCLEAELAVLALEGALGAESEPESSAAHWGPLAVRLEQALQAGDPVAVREALPPFLEAFSQEPLLFLPLAQGGEPRQVLRTRLNQAVVRALASVLPRLGLLRETYQILRTARRMELEHPPEGRGVTDLNSLFQIGYEGVVSAIVTSAATWPEDKAADASLVDVLEQITSPFLGLWIEHSRSLSLSALEPVTSSAEWERLKDFVTRYGRDLFHTRFLTLANLRGILHRGIAPYLDYLRDNADPLHPIKLLDEIGHNISEEEAVRCLNIILAAVAENYEEYKDFNATVALSDYGDNLYILLDLLRLKTAYERQSWHFRPLVMAHDVLARRGRDSAAVLWEDGFGDLTQEAATEFLDQLGSLERQHRLRLGTIADRVQERFVKPLALDRLCARIEAAMGEAATEGDRPAFARLRAELAALASTPTGVGLDVPQWLRRLQAEVQRVRRTQGNSASLADAIFHIPRRPVSPEDLEQQMSTWEDPLIR